MNFPCMDYEADTLQNEWDKLFPPEVNTGSLDISPPQ